MSKAHELTLLGKWTDGVLPPLSPTSPKATKFCCCPNRRRYNIKQPKAKSTLDARNIFLDNEFTYIDDVNSTEANSNITNHKSSTSNGSSKGYKTCDVVESTFESIDNNEIIKAKNSSDYENYDNSINDADTIGVQPLNCEGTEQKCDKQKQCEHSNNNKKKQNCIKLKEKQKKFFVTKTLVCDNENVAGCSTTSPLLQHHQQQNQKQQQEQQQTINNNQQNEHKKCHNNFRSEQRQQQQQQEENPIQRLSNSEINNCNNHKEIQNIHQKGNDCHCYLELNDNTKATTTTLQATATELNNSPNNYYQRQQQQESIGGTYTNSIDVVDSHSKQREIDLPNTMTITTTTNVANRKNSECGLTITTPKSSSSMTSTTSATIMQAHNQTESLIAKPISPTTTLAATPTIKTTTTTMTTTTTAKPSTTPCPLTPSLTTVIKTTMVKRSPANESTSATTTPTTTIAKNIAMASVYNDNEKSIASQAIINSSQHGEKPKVASPETNDRLSVKERIAALVAGSEQIKLHDNSIRIQDQCNKNQSNMTIAKTQNVQSAINSLQHHKQRQPVISADRNDSKSSNCSKSNKSNKHNANNNNISNVVISAITTPTSKLSLSSSANAAGKATPSSSASCSSTAQTKALISINDIPPCHESGLNDAQRVSFALPCNTMTTSDAAVQAALLASNTGCATLPRRRSPASAASLHERNILKHGSNTGANMTASDKNCATTLMQPTANASSSFSTSTQSAETTSRKLAALDNLDLALNLELNDDDGEDPYYALQEYLERVKHEINEVFELHKARQRMQQEQEQQQQSAAPESIATTTTSTTTTTASNDELSRSTESDSGFDSASGGHYQSKNNMTGSNNNHSSSNNNNSQLQISATDGVHNVQATEISCPNDINGHASFVKSITNAEKSALTESSETNKENQQQQQQQLEKQNKSQIANRKTTSVNSLPSATATATSTATVEEQTNRRLTKLRALPPPPLNTIRNTNVVTSANVGSEDVNIWANKFLRDLDNLMANDKPSNGISSSSVSSSPTSTTSPMLLSAAAKAAIQCRYGKVASTIGAATGDGSDHREHVAAGHNNSAIVLVRPEKHATIPLQSFNLDCGRLDNCSTAVSGGSTNGNPTKTHIAYMRTLSAPTPYQQQQYQLQQQQLYDNKLASIASGKSNRNSLATFNAITELQQHTTHQQNLTNSQSKNAATNNSNLGEGTQETTTTTTLLKIEETAATSGRRTSTKIATKAETAAEDIIGNEESLKHKRQRQLENDMETIRNSLATIEALGCNSSSNDKNMSVASTTMATSIPKRERINHVATTLTTPNGYSSNTSSITSKPATTSSGALALTSSPASSSSSSPSTKATLTTTSPTTAGYLLNGSEATKKGSTSTIWTSEESILRSVGAVDEDNNSTSSSACEEASGVLSSGKSGISLDSSGLDNDNNESGIGTATPPKDLAYWKSIRHNDNESVNSLDALRKTKFQKSSSVASSDDPDLLEVLSLCDEPRNGNVDEDVDESQDHIDDRQKQQQQQQQQTNNTLQHRRITRYNRHHNQLQHNQLRRQQEIKNNDSLSSQATVDAIEANENSIILDETTHADEDDEVHDEFETVPYCDCEYTDGDISSASGSSVPNGSPIATHDGSLGNGINGVVLRRKYSATPIMVPYSGGRWQKNRSHSLDTSSLPSTYHMHSSHHIHHHLHHPHHVGQSQLSRKLHHLQNRSKERGKLSLALRQEPFQSLLAPAHFHELPSPSSASLHSGHESLGIQELTTKSNSAPLLLKKEKQKRDDFVGQKLSLRYSRSQSDRYLAEIEAVEACKWLRAAGFPQYAQMYEDQQFPLDITNVAKDHTNLENDQLQSLYRRLQTLNRCANMRLDQSHKPQTPQKEDSDDENFALSENWTFQPHIRRWSRIGEGGLELPPVTKLNAEKTESSSKESSPDRFEDDSYDMSGAMLSATLPNATCDSTEAQDGGDEAAVRLRRTGSERLKDGAKALLRRVESIKSRRRKRQNRDGLVISGPQAFDLSQLGQRSSLRKPEAVYSTPPSPSAVSPMHTFPAKSPFYGNELKVPSQSENFLSPNRASPKRTPTTPRSMRTSPLHFFSNAMPHLREGKSDDSSSYYSDSQESSTGGKITLRKTPSKTRRFLQRTGKVDDIGAHSDSECHHGRKLLIKDANSNTTEVKVKKLIRGGSLNLGRDSKKREGVRSSSFRSRSTSRKEGKTDDADGIKKSPVVRWHSFQMEERPQMVFRKCFSQKIDPQQHELGTSFAAMSAGQLQIIRKLALVILTGYMERYCPTHRSGWNWELPKFIKKMKLPPDYKDKKVFGLPLLLVLQRTGQTLPIAVRAAFRWLQLNALDQIGLFRKSGVKSRIIRLKELIEYSESTSECMEIFDTQQAYDVADMLKQYFRDLPESLLTTKMSETFVAIFQHLPPEVRLDAVQSAVLLLPDENREILYALLEFLTLVASNAKYNQMTANNLAVCLAPSLFHNSVATGAGSVSASPRRRNKGGMPDNKELSEAKALHECLAFMIENYKQIYTASKEKIQKCNFGYMEESKPVPLEALGEGMQFHNWRGYLYECTSATIKEGREKTRGWFTVTTQTDPNVDVAYKKVGDGHPLRLWRCITDVEGPPKEVMSYIIKQRASWDPSLLQCQTLKKLDDRTEIYQYAIDGQVTTDFCVLRSWQTDLPRGACVIVETSIDHAKAKPLFGAVRGVVLASRYLIEPCGSGKSRVMHLARVDIKGRTPEWYNKCFGHLCSHYLAKIRSDFKNITEGPESKV